MGAGGWDVVVGTVVTGGWDVVTGVVVTGGWDVVTGAVVTGGWDVVTGAVVTGGWDVVTGAVATGGWDVVTGAVVTGGWDVVTGDVVVVGACDVVTGGAEVVVPGGCDVVETDVVVVAVVLVTELVAVAVVVLPDGDEVGAAASRVKSTPEVVRPAWTTTGVASPASPWPGYQVGTAPLAVEPTTYPPGRRPGELQTPTASAQAVMESPAARSTGVMATQRPAAGAPSGNDRVPASPPPRESPACSDRVAPGASATGMAAPRVTTSS